MSKSEINMHAILSEIIAVIWHGLCLDLNGNAQQRFSYKLLFTIITELKNFNAPQYQLYNENCYIPTVLEIPYHAKVDQYKKY